jgi:DNA gyrase subunit A
MGRTAYGVKGVTLDEGDAVVSAETLLLSKAGEVEPTLLTVTGNGYGKRTELAEYRVQSRGGKGIITIKTTERNGPVVAVATVTEVDEVMLITNQGMLIRMPAKGISVIGRNTQGVRLITLESKEEQVVALARVAEASPDEPQENGGDEGPAGGEAPEAPEAEA